MTNVKNQLLNELRVYLDKHQPYWPGRIIPENLRSDAEGSLAHVFRQPYILRSYIQDCCYIIELEFQGFYSLQNTTPIDIIHGASLDP